jgi:hypothetical protein
LFFVFVFVLVLVHQQCPCQPPSLHTAAPTTNNIATSYQRQIRHSSRTTPLPWLLRNAPPPTNAPMPPTKCCHHTTIRILPPNMTTFPSSTHTSLNQPHRPYNRIIKAPPSSCFLTIPPSSKHSNS